MKIKLTILLWVIALTAFSQGIVINEVMTSNSNTILDDFGEPSDWLELYNDSEETIDISGWYLTDDEAVLMKWQFPNTTMLPGSFLLVFCSDRDTLSAYLHTNFKLKASGEELILSNQQGEEVDEVDPVDLDVDISYGRVADGAAQFDLFYTTSPGFTNAMNIKFIPIEFSLISGFYSPSTAFAIDIEDETAQVYFTLNSCEPIPGTAYTYLYNEPLLLDSLNQIPVIYSNIPTTPLNNYGYVHWMPPLGPVEKYIVVRARAFAGEQALCNTITNTYFASNDISNRFVYPVLSLVTDSVNLFDDTIGIYVPGIHHDSGVVKSGNYWERGLEWERKANFEYFSSTGELLVEKQLGVRIQGNLSRAMPQKSLQYFPREEYDGDGDMDYPFFEAYEYENYDRLISRSIFCAHEFSIVRDEIMQEIVKNMNVFYQEMQPITLFINGEYWGFQVMRENQDEHYLKQHLDYDPDSVDIITATWVLEAGDFEEHLIFRDFIENHDLSIQENYDSASAMVDIPAYIDYYVAEIFVSNQDWPGNNYTKFRKKGPGNMWRWFIYDMDNGGIHLTANNLLRATGDSITGINPEWSTIVFQKFMENETFRSQFLTRFEYLLNTDLCPSNTIAVVDKWQEILEYEWANTTNRWDNFPDHDTWLNTMDDLRTFFELRPGYVLQHLSDYFETDTLHIECESLINNDKEESPFTLYPNPTSSELNLLSYQNIDQIKIYSTTGLLVRNIFTGNQRVISVNMNDLPEGLYILVVSINNKTYSEKIIKSR